MDPAKQTRITGGGGGRGTPIVSTPLERTAADLSRSKYMVSARATSMSAVARPALSTLPSNTSSMGQLKLFTANDDDDNNNDNEEEEDDDDKKVLFKRTKPSFRSNPNLAMNRSSTNINLPKKVPSSTLESKLQIPTVNSTTTLKQQVPIVAKSTPEVHKAILPKTAEILKPVSSYTTMGASLEVQPQQRASNITSTSAFSSSPPPPPPSPPPSSSASSFTIPVQEISTSIPSDRIVPRDASLSMNDLPSSHVQNDILPSALVVTNNLTSATDKVAPQQVARVPDIVSTEREDSFTFKSAKQSSSSSSLRGGRSAHSSGRIEVSENFVAMNLKKKKIRTLRGGKRSGKYHGGNNRGGFTSYPQRNKPLGLQVDDAQGIGSGRSKYSINKLMDEEDNTDVDNDDEDVDEEDDNNDSYEIAAENSSIDIASNEGMDGQKTRPEQPLLLPASGLTMSQADMQAEVEAELRTAAIVAARSFVPLGATDSQAAARLGGFNNGRSSFSYVSAAASAAGGGMGNGGGAIDGGAGRTAKVDGGDVLEACLDALDTSRPPSTSLKSSTKSLSGGARVTKVKSTIDDRSDRGRPLCSGHQLECAMRKVKKEGPNKGRWFYSCPADKDAQCGFFCWKDADSRAAVTRFLEAASEAALAEAAASAAALSSSSANSSGGLSVAAKFHLQVEHRVRCASLLRWNDKAYGVTSLRAEIVRREIGPKIPKSLLEQARAQDLKLAIDSVKGTKANAKSSNPKKKAKTAANVTDAPESKTRISTAVNVTKPFVATSSAAVSTTSTSLPLAAAIVDDFAFAEVAQTKVTKVAQEDENEVIDENVSNGSSGNSDDSSLDSSEDSSESDVDDADDKETGGDVTMKVDDEDEDSDEGFRRRKKVLGKRRAAPKKSQQRRKEVPSDTDEETAIDVDKDGASLDDRSKRQTKEPSVSVNSLRRHECVAVLVFDDVSVWREAVSRRKAVPPQIVSSVDQNVSTVNQNEGDSMDMASVSHQTHMTHDSSDETPLRDPIGKILYTTLKKTFGYTSFRGEKQLVDLSTLEIIKPSLSEPILSESMPSSISPSSTIQPVEMTIQEWACRRVLEGKSTLIVAATGTGKSLCYQLPAMILGNSISSRGNNGNSVGEITTKGPYLPYGITVVISPLVSLMRDQMLRLPRGLTGICISGSGSQGAEDAASALIALRDRRAHVLFVSPERLFSRSFSRLARDPDVMPAVACVCVDEAHVMSEWSHNFRPSYLRLNSLIDDLLRPRSVLALTATATPSVTEQVALSLRINNGGTWISGWRRPNLRFSASWTGPLTPEELRKREREWRKEHPGANEAEFRAFPQKITDIDRSKALLDLLKAVAMVGVPQDAAPAASLSTRADNEADEKIASASKDMTRQTSRGDSVDDALLSGQPPSSIIYTSSQAEADAIATFLSGHGVSAAAYHAGMGLDQRHRVHSRFLSGSVRVVAATIAFGMGLDKPDVRLIVHYSLPRSIEEYVQQCGRAGRDGLPALCHALVDRTGEDARRLHSLTHGDELEWRQIAGLLLMLVTNGARAMRVARSSSALICDHVFKLYKRSTRQEELTELLLKCGVGGGDVERTTTASLQEADDVPSTSNGVEFTVSISSLAARLGLKSEVAETILCYLEALGSVDIIGPRHTHVDITIISGSGGALKNDPIIQAAMMLAQSHGAKPSTSSGSTSSFSPLSGLDPATRLLFPSSLFGVEAVDLKTSRGGGGGGGRAGQSSFYLDNSYGRSQPREEPSRSQTASEPAWVAHDDRGRLVIRACLDDLAIFITAMQIESECAQAISAGQAKPSYFRRMTVSNLQRHLFNLQSSKVVQLQFRDWGIAVRIDAECSSLYNASAEAACLLVHPPEALQAFLSRALADEDMHNKDSQNDRPGGASDVPTVRAASGMGLPPLLFPLLLTLYNKVLKNTDLSLRRLDSSYALLQATAADTWREAFSLLRKSGRSTRDGGQNSPEALLLDLVGRYLSGADGTGALVLNNAHNSCQEAVILRLPLIPLPASERRALSMDVLACVRKIKVLLGSDALTSSEDAWKDEPGNGGGGGGGGGLLSVSTVITRVPLVARPEAWKWWSMTDALPPQIPSPIINASAVARILHGIPSALFPSRDFRPPGQYGRGGGDSVWSRWSAYKFENVKEVAANVLKSMGSVKFS